MTSGSQTISALSSLDNQVTLTADGEGRNIAWTFNNENNTLTYEKVINKSTVTITADDNITTNSIHIDLLPPAVPSFSINCTNNPNLSHIKLPNWTSGSHSFNCTNLTTSCSNKGDIWTSINTTLLGLPSVWTLHNYPI